MGANFFLFEKTPFRISAWEQILFFLRRSLFRTDIMCRKANRKSQKLFPLYQIIEKSSNVSGSLKQGQGQIIMTEVL